MRPSPTTLSRAVALTACATALAAGPAKAQLINPVCAEACPDPVRFPLEAAACVARQRACTERIVLYQSYMAQLGLGTTLRGMPARYVQILQPHFPGVNLGAWRFAHGDRQPPNNTTTDCTVTYFSNPTTVTRLSTGELSTDQELSLLFHELRHFVQCMQQPGRDRYARMWFNQLELTFLRNADLATLHDRMPMEGDADAAAATVLAGVAANRDASGRLVQPIRATLATASGPVSGPIATRVGSVLRLTAQVTGGSPPLELDWRWRQPGETGFFDGDALARGGTTFEFTAEKIGTYDVQLRVRQPGSGLVPAFVTAQVRVDPPLVIATGSLTSTSPVSTVTGTRLTTGVLAVRVLRRTRLDPTLRPLGGATVALGTSTNGTAYGSRQTATDGTVRFDGLPIVSTQALVVAASRTFCAAATAQYTPTSAEGSVQLVLTCQ